MADIETLKKQIDELDSRVFLAESKADLAMDKADELESILMQVLDHLDLEMTKPQSN